LEALGGYSPPLSPAREVASLVFLVLLGVTALLERLQFTLRKTEASTWWASNGRDVLNAVALAVIALGLKGLGFQGPIAWCIDATFVVLLSALQMSVAKHRLAGLWSVLWAVALGLPILVAPGAVHDFFRASLERLFPGT